MPFPAWFSAASDAFEAQLVALLARMTEWSDRLYWEGYEPLAKAVLLVAAGVALIICLYAYTDDKDVQIWSTLTVAGRWMGGLVMVIAVLAAWASRHAAA